MAGRRQQPHKTADLPPAVDPLVAGEEDVASKNLLIFQIAGESFALRLASVAEIIRLPDLAHMPLAPPSLLGLANLRGLVLPVVSLRALLKLRGMEANEQTRVIVMRGGAAVGFVVDRIDRLLAVAAHELEHDEAGAGTTDAALLDETIDGSEGQSTIKLLNPSRLLSGQFARLGISTTHAANRSPVAIGSPAAAQVQALISLLSFRLGEQEYALPLDRVREIVPLPAISRRCLGRKPPYWALSRCGTACYRWYRSAPWLGWWPATATRRVARSWWCHWAWARSAWW